MLTQLVSPVNTASTRRLPGFIHGSCHHRFVALNLIYKIQYIELSIFMVPKLVDDRITVNPRPSPYRLRCAIGRAFRTRRGKRAITSKRREIRALRGIASRDEEERASMRGHTAGCSVRENDDVLRERICPLTGGFPSARPSNQIGSASPEWRRMKVRCSRSERCARVASCEATALKMRRCWSISSARSAPCPTIAR